MEAGAVVNGLAGEDEAWPVVTGEAGEDDGPAGAEDEA